MIQNFNLMELMSLAGVGFGAYRLYEKKDLVGVGALVGAGLIKLNSAGASQSTFGEDSSNGPLKLANVNGLEALVLAGIAFGAYRLFTQQEYLAAIMCVVPLFITGRESAQSNVTF